jgi:VCBS repeat-containing protein
MFRHLVCTAAVFMWFSGCGNASAPDADLVKAEAFIDAFYSFDPDRLGPMLDAAPESVASIMSYQGFAEGGNYKILQRGVCIADADHVISCSITVQDDPVLALKTGFNVTDTFTLTFVDGQVVTVETSSNDQPVYFEARKWVERELPEVMAGPCKKDGATRATPGDCARAMTEGYRRFAESDEYPR